MALSLLSTLSLAVIALAPAAPTAKTTNNATEAQTVQRTADIGSMLYAFDRAAWVASDAMTAKIPRDRLSGDGGWATRPH